MEQLILKVENLTVCYKIEGGKCTAVNNVSFELNRGDSLGIIGESGSGKTSLAMAIMGLLKSPAEVSGKIYYENIDLQRLSQKERNRFRWCNIAIVFQNSLDVLNPVLTVHEQIFECIIKHMEITEKEADKKVRTLLEMVGLGPDWGQYYPHQLSGGMRQRVLIAMALSCEPDVLIVDEPTTALDAVSKNEIVELIAKLHKEKNFALIVISHEIQTILSLTSRINVMYSGHIVEAGLTGDVIRNPMHTYTRGLLDSSPTINPYRDMWGIPGEVGNNEIAGCPFYLRCSQSIELCKTKIPQLEYVSVERKVACNRGGIVTLLHGKGIDKKYRFKGKSVIACDDCEIKIRYGEVAALIGESGSGKTTLASILSGIIQADKGEILFEGEKVSGNNTTCRRNGIQIVFQDPFSATNEHFTIEKAVKEPLDILKIGTNEERKEKVIQALKDVQLPYDKGFLLRKCYMLSGGQRQRVALARSLVMEPRLLIADEISSMLDPSTQANILRLLKGLQNEKGFAMLYITHDLTIARKIADRVYVMHRGRIIEKGLASQVFCNPVESYTKKLVKEGLKSNALLCYNNC